MHILISMFGKGLGGIEQCLLDYAEALMNEGHQVTCFIQPTSAIKNEILKLRNVNILEIKNHGQWDIFAKFKLKKELKNLAPDIMIAHGNRALKLLYKKHDAPLVTVTHNYKLKHIKKADAVLALTSDLENEAINNGADKKNIYRVPNMIRLSDVNVKKDTILKSPPVIGAMGRLVKKKGFDIYLKALKILKDDGVKFKAILAGSGEEDNNLKLLAKELDFTEDDLTFSGWVNDKELFFSQLDIFCTPSLHEPFGIIVLESLARNIPTISSESEGPSEILTHNENALLYSTHDENALAESIKLLLENDKLRKTTSQNGIKLIKEIYDINIVGKSLSNALIQIKNLTHKH